MLKTVRAVLVGTSVIAMAAAAGVQGAAAATASPAARATVCSGALAPGTYHGLIVKRACIISRGPVLVSGDVVLKPGSVFNAVSTAVLTVRGNILVGRGALVGLGCSPEVGCKTLTPDRFHGNIVARQPLDVIVQSGTIFGHVFVTGGGGGRNCKTNPLLKSPNFSTIEDTTVRGTVTFAGMRSCWFGMIRDHIHGNVIIRGNKWADPDANEVVTNVFFGSVFCRNNVPEPQVGDSKGKPNVIFGSKRGCPQLPVR
jgi:hypothetical protein